MFNTIQQYKNRLQLANHLENNIHSYEYDHSSLNIASIEGKPCCALGHAHKAGLHDWRSWTTNEFYGKESWCDIFDGKLGYSRQGVIEKLRTWKRPPFIWRFIHV
jgi:hypothetical protein